MIDPQEIIKNLGKRYIDASYFATSREAADYILSIIPAGSRVGIGGSLTIEALEIEEGIKEKGCTLYWQWRVPPEKVLETRKAQLTSDYFLTSTNAITRDGLIYNVDGIGNRVAAMIFGPGKVIIVAGKNKFVEDLDAAIERVKRIAAPENAKRLGLPLPCVDGECVDCRLPGCICNVETIIKGRPRATEMEVILVGEDLGF